VIVGVETCQNLPFLDQRDNVAQWMKNLELHLRLATLLDRKPLEIGSQTAHCHGDDAQWPMEMARDGLRLLPLTRAITLKFEGVSVNLLPDFLASNAG
jgi:hypothetical protein